MNQPGSVIEWIFDKIYEKSPLYRNHCIQIKSLQKTVDDYRFYYSDLEKQSFET